MPPSSGLAVIAPSLCSVQPDARFVMVTGLPIPPEVASHACIADFPQQNTLTVYLLNFWLGHKKREPKLPALHSHFRRGRRH